MNIQEIIRNPELYVPFKAGQVVFREGDVGDIMYVLMEGQIEVRVNDHVVGIFEPIEVFGEMAVIDPKPRSATVIAKTDCKLAPINQKRFKFLIQQRPEFAIDIMRILVERIRWMDTMAKSAESGSNDSSMEDKVSEAGALDQNEKGSTSPASQS